MDPFGKRVTVGATATVLVRNASSAVLRNLGSVDVDLGSSGVASGAAFPLKAGETLAYDFRLSRTGVLYGIVASGTAEVAVLSEPVQ